jgi:hypothetical protein
MNEPFLKTRTRGFLINYVGVRIICSDRKLKTKIVRDKQVLKMKFVG